MSMALALWDLERGVLTKIVLSVLLLAGALVVRAVVVRAVARSVDRLELRRKWVVSIRNGVIVLVGAGLTAIWADALRTLAVSLIALAVAVVIATKELLQSVLASLTKAVTNPFSLGDRIEIAGYRGDVIDQNLLTTTIVEVGPGKAFHMRTGRKITFPNSLLLSTCVVNESYTEQFVVHSFSIPLKLEEDWQRAERILLEAAEEQCHGFREAARESMRKLEENYGLDGLSVDPRVHVQVTDPGRLNLLVRFAAPVGRQGRIEQAIVRRFLVDFYGTGNKNGDSPSAPRSGIGD